VRPLPVDSRGCRRCYHGSHSVGVLVLDNANLARLFVRIRYVRKIERLASFRQRGPRIPQACIMFTLSRVICFLRQRCASGGRFPGGLTLGSGSHPVLSTSSATQAILRPSRTNASWCHSIFLAEEKIAEPLGRPQDVIERPYRPDTLLVLLTKSP
jgi:hypothetical protein